MPPLITCGVTMRAISRLAAIAAAGVLISGCGSPGPGAGGHASAPVTSSSPAQSATSAGGSSAAASTPVVALPAGYQPLFPFATPAQVRAWQAGYTSGGHQPWHLSASRTALAFTMGYLGFKDLNKVTKQAASGTDSRISVGFTLPNGRLTTSAVVHLVRFGSGPLAPWEVVGTDDTTFSLSTPAYGAAVASPVAIGGKITGVDESIRAGMHQLQSATPVGTSCCTPAGGQRSPWSATVTFHAASGQVITIVVSTGGHVSAVERFAVTGVRVK
jgi:hypothetical protein